MKIFKLVKFFTKKEGLQMSPNEKVELKLRNIVDSGKPKTITIDGKKFTSQKTK